ncbi:MAG TPA: hypothetical protein VGM17_13070 [Rhizomicrobium sp.]|jgi:hypothetical protein
MIVAAYYVGLIAWWIPQVWSGFLRKELDDELAALFGLGFICYLAWGWYLFGWKVALINVVLFLLIGRVVWLPLKRVGLKLFPNSKFRVRRYDDDLHPAVLYLAKKVRFLLGHRN